MREMTELEAAYFAGLMDGEGWFTIHSKSHSVPYYYMYCGIKMTNRASIDLLSEITGASVKEYSYKPECNNKNTYQVNLYGERARNFIHQVYPYLIVKKEHASILLQFPQGYSRNSEDREMLFSVLKKLNKRGRDI